MGPCFQDLLKLICGHWFHFPVESATFNIGFSSLKIHHVGNSQGKSNPFLFKSTILDSAIRDVGSLNFTSGS